MEYINIHKSILDSMEFTAASDAQQGTWVKLLGYLCGQEQGDRIKSAKLWADRVWTKQAISPVILKKPSPLWQWEGDDLIVNFYPHKQEAAMKAVREGGARGAAKTNARRAGGTPGGASPGATDSPARNGKEGKGNEMEGKVSATTAEPPFEDEVSAFCAGFQDMARGVSGIPEVWWRGWFANALRFPFPSDWQRCLVNAFLGDFTARLPRALGYPNFDAKKIAPPENEIPAPGGVVDWGQMIAPQEGEQPAA
jgi:hypothetical protein